MALARDGELDVAILDVRIQGHYIFPVADILIDRNLPFIFATTLMPHDTPARHRNRPLLKNHSSRRRSMRYSRPCWLSPPGAPRPNIVLSSPRTRIGGQLSKKLLRRFRPERRPRMIGG